MKYRYEFDSLGKIKVPSNKYWGASTQRSNKHFDIGDFLVRPIVIKSIAMIKKAAAIVNAKDGSIDKKVTQYSLTALNVDEHGLDEMDNRILTTIIDKFKGGPVGLTTIATAVGEQSGTIEEVYEPFLIMEGYLMRTPRGRQATDLAFKHLGKTKSADQGNLF